ncbi:MAG: amino acid carrier protein [Oscillospiraceae bacterium]|nr:amino acid carrier protein [Oscillospiraceae bacterium]
MTNTESYIFLPLAALILICGAVYSFRTRFIQMRGLACGLKLTFGSSGSVSDKDGAAIAPFRALCTSLSATIGTGNIVGVSAALTTGGPGALFWMWAAAFFGMAVKYAEAFLAVKFRETRSGQIIGGPFFYISKAFSDSRAARTGAKLFAFFGACAALFGIGCAAQSNSVAVAAQNIFDQKCLSFVYIFGECVPTVRLVSGLIVAAAGYAIFSGGIKRIGAFSAAAVPVMGGLYILASVAVIIMNREAIPAAFSLIFKSAFTPAAAAGGFGGALVRDAVAKGITRGIFANEAGLGSTPIAAAAGSATPGEQGLVSMSGTLFDTFIVCTLTGLCVLITGAWTQGLYGFDVTLFAFTGTLGEMGRLLLSSCLALFAFTSIIGWNYYGERCFSFLSNGRWKKAFNAAFSALLFVGALMTTKNAFFLADILNALMALPNLSALLILALNDKLYRKTGL